MLRCGMAKSGTLRLDISLSGGELREIDALRQSMGLDMEQFATDAIRHYKQVLIDNPDMIGESVIRNIKHA